jgi:hypothetical protein
MIKRDYAQEREDALEERNFHVQQLKEKRAHDLELARLKLSVKPRNDKWRTLAKAPTYGLAIICVTILTLAGKPVPTELSDFIAK